MKFGLNVLHDDDFATVSKWYEIADRGGVDMIAVPDSPALLRELYVTFTLAVLRTTRAQVISGVTNPTTRDPSVAASALFSLAELAPGRVGMGIGSGDSAAWGVGLGSSPVSRLREYILAVKAILSGEQGRFFDRDWAAQWDRFDPPVRAPVYVACSGPRVLRMAAQVADGVIVSMGYAPGDVAYVGQLVADACGEVGRDPSEVEVWWTANIEFADSVAEGREQGLCMNTAWMTMGSLEGKRIPPEHRDALVQLNREMHGIQNQYKNADRHRRTVQRARELGIYEWLESRSPKLWGTPQDVARRFLEFGEQGVSNWLLYVGGKGFDKATHIRMFVEAVLPAVHGSAESTESATNGASAS